MRKKVLLGATKNNEVVFSEVEIRENINGKLEFSASFETVYPFKYDEDYLWGRLENQLHFYDKSDLYDLCETYDCRPSELAEKIWADSYIEDIIDISLYPDSIEVDGSEWYFESSACGQCDTR